MLVKFKMMFTDGFFHIIASNTINKIISLCSGIIIVRVLSKNDYGIYSYVLNIINIILLTNGLGTLTGIVQYGCEFHNDLIKQKAIIKYGFYIGLSFNIVISIFIVFYGFFFNKSIPNTDIYFILAAFIPISNYITDTFLSILRIKEKNKEYSIYTSFNSFLTFFFILLGAILFSIKGAVTFRYISASISIFFGYITYDHIKNTVFGEKNDIDKEIKKSFIKFSLLSCANNSIAHLFYNIDIFLIGLIISNPEIIASYKVASTIPLSLTFLTSSIVLYIYPKYVKNRYNPEWLKKNYIILLICLATLNGIISISLYILAPWVIKLIFGIQYVETSLYIFRVLIIGFFITSTLRIPSGNILDMLHLIKPNFYISIFCGIANILLDILLIKEYGFIGAAIGTVIIYFIYGSLSNMVIIIYIKRLFNNRN